MGLNNLIFPKPFSLGSRDPEAIAHFQQVLFKAATNHQGRLRRHIIAAGTKVFRNVPAQISKEVASSDLDGKNTATFKLPSSMTPEEARTIPPAASNTIRNRWSGQLPRLNISRGALYLSSDPVALANEALRYSRDKITKKVPWKGAANGEAEYTVFGPAARELRQLLVNRMYFVFRLTKAIQILDLTPALSAEFYDRVESSQEYRKAKTSLGLEAELWKLAFDPVDYTVSRPLGIAALLNTSADGVQVQTAQNETADSSESGKNLVIGGADGTLVGFLCPVGKLLEGIDGGRTALMEISLGGGRIEDGAILPGSLIPTDK